MLIKRFKQWLQTLTIVLLFAVLPLQVLSLPKCSQNSKNWNNCYGIVKADGISYRGEFKNNDYHGVGRMEINDADGRWFYYGEWAGGEQNGEGIEVHETLGLIMEGIFVNNSLIKPQKTRFSKDVSFLKISFRARKKNERILMQSILKDLGLYNSTVDGLYGNNTYEAFIAYNNKYSKIKDLQNIKNVFTLFDAIMKKDHEQATNKPKETALPKETKEKFEKELEKSLKTVSKDDNAHNQYVVGWYYLALGKYEKSMQWLTFSANKDYPPAQFSLAEAHFYGWGVPKNYRLSLNLYKKSSSGGNIKAHNRLGQLYYHGEEETEKNYDESLRYFRLSASKGDPFGQRYIGIHYFNGFGVQKDLEKAVSWWVKSAEQGDEIAQVSLAVSYANGDGVIQDQVYAHMWANIAAYRGYEKAKKLRDDIAKNMSSTQLDKAQELARTCVKNKFIGC